MKDHAAPGLQDALSGGFEPRTFDRLRAGLPSEPLDRDVAVEAPVSVEVNGIGFAVMMATPLDLEDFALGFARAEGLISGIDEVRDAQIHRHPLGWIVRLRVGEDATRRVLARARTRVTETACGLCGLENLEALGAPLPRVSRPSAPSAEAAERARGAVRGVQDLGRRTGATHAAALCDPAGRIVLVREDVGRHNAMDKLVGAGMRAGVDLAAHFALVTSRLSFELVEKAARADLGALVALSAPTTLALSRAEEAGLPVIALARPDGALAARPGSREGR